MKTQLEHALLLVLATLCAVAPTWTATQPFALTIEAKDPAVKAGSEVQVAITLRNTSNRAMDMTVGLTERDYAFDVRDSQNRTPPETDLTQKSKGRAYFSNDQTFTLQPGESLPKAILSLTKFYDLSHPGRYTVQVSRVVQRTGRGDNQIEHNHDCGDRLTAQTCPQAVVERMRPTGR